MYPGRPRAARPRASCALDDGMARIMVKIGPSVPGDSRAMLPSIGGILVDDGWLRILGGSHPRLPRDLARWNFPDGNPTNARMRGAFLVADDAIGGFFAINAGALPGPQGHVFY